MIGRVSQSRFSGDCGETSRYGVEWRLGEIQAPFEEIPPPSEYPCFGLCRRVGMTAALVNNTQGTCSLDYMLTPCAAGMLSNTYVIYTFLTRLLPVPGKNSCMMLFSARTPLPEVTFLVPANKLLLLSK